MTPLLLMIAVLYFCINVSVFLVMALDKWRSRRGEAGRISEGVLFFLASCFGSLGVWTGMLIFRHKTQKWYFVLGIPLLFLEHVTLFFLIAHWLEA